MSDILNICSTSIVGGYIGMVIFLLIFPSSPWGFGLFSAEIGWIVGAILGGILAQFFINKKAKKEREYLKKFEKPGKF